MNQTTAQTIAQPFDPGAFDPRRTQQQPARRCVSFGIGQVVVTPGARAALDASGEVHDLYLQRHATGDWRETPANEQDENRAAISYGRGVLTMHRLRSEARLWIATTEDRSRTVAFLPDEI